MKTNKPHNFLLLALTAVFSCCSGEDYSDITVSGTPAGETSTAPLTITVTDGGYASLSGGSSTRASEVDYRTVFTAGDRIGVFAVKDGAIVKEVSNLCLTASPSTDTNAPLTWKSASDETPASINGATYYAYYPYKSDLKIADLDPAANTAAGFFASVITNWTPATNQSTYADYTAQDLMIAQSDVSNKSLSFSMSHQMALVVIDLPNKTYSLSNDPTYTWKVDVSDTKFNDFTPYRTDNGMYRYLVHPSTDDALLSGSYTGEYGTTAWKVNTKSIPAGNYKIYKVDKGTQLTHTLAVGDFYMKDGSLLAGSTASLTPEQKDACIGIVFWVGDATQKDQILRSDHPNCTHGLVVALKDVEGGTSAWQSPFSSVQDWLNEHHSREYLSVVSGTGSGDPLNNIQGYNNTKAIEEFNAATANGGNIVQAVVKVAEYRDAVPAPTNSSDWYLPSEKELTLLCGREVDDIWSKNLIGIANRDFINGKLNSLNSVATTIIHTLYWSSTESSNDRAFYMDFANGHVLTYYKNSPERVRCVLAF